MADGNLLTELVVRAQGGDLEAFGRLVHKTQAMAYAVAKGVLRDRGLAEDATQEAFLRAYRRLRDLDEPRGFGAWLRRIVITVALNMRRARRHTFLRLDDVPEVPSVFWLVGNGNESCRARQFIMVTHLRSPSFFARQAVAAFIRAGAQRP